jgi:hypothetical protein
MEFFDRMERDKRQGKALAEKNRYHIVSQVRTHDRYQASWAMNNMIRALEMHPWLNTVDDWQRYFEAKIIRAARSPQGSRRGRPRKNPHSARLRAQKRGEVILFRGKTALVKGSRAEINHYLYAHRIMQGEAGYWELAV